MLITYPSFANPPMVIQDISFYRQMVVKKIEK